MINYSKDCRGNFRIDLDGVPLSTAGGNMPDIEVDFEGFKVIVEVTMSSGSKQYEMEGEPVARHYGKIQRDSEEPVYCIFVAPKINENSLAHFFNLNRFNTKAYGGKTRIVPMNLEQFILFITIAKEQGFSDPSTLANYLERRLEENQSAEDEEVWMATINDSLGNWVEAN